MQLYTIACYFSTQALSKTEEKDKTMAMFEICSSCLEYLVENKCDHSNIPENGLEKLIYQLLKQTELRFVYIFWEAVTSQLREIKSWIT